MCSYQLRKHIVKSALAALLIWTVICLLPWHGRTDTAEASLADAAAMAKVMYESSDFTELVARQWEVVTRTKAAILGTPSDDPDESAGTPTADSLGGQISTIVAALASGLVMLNIWMTIIRESMRGDPSLEFWIKIFTVMAVALFLVIFTPTILGGIDKIGNTIINQFVDKGQISTQEAGAMIQSTLDEQDKDEMRRAYAASALDMMIEDGTLSESLLQSESREDIIKQIIDLWDKQNEANAMNQDNFTETVTAAMQSIMDALREFVNPTGDTFSTSLSTTIKVALIRLLRIGFLCAVYAQIFMIAIQLAIRTLLAPIAVAGITGEGMRSSGIRYLKRLLSLYLQYVIVLIFAFMFSTILITVSEQMAAISGAEGIGKQFLMIYALISCMGAMIVAVGQSGSIAMEVLGD